MPDIEKRRTEYFWAVGCSRKGKLTKRDGEVVRCGHNHEKMKDAAGCLKTMISERPGNCQRYKIVQLTEIVYEREPK